ncbi:hypothetical protein Kpol_1039p31 [Vanderwaltozyma polyspora DSM 70294]|uniref:6-phosphofructo-2-kinase domain-containing protein n=1 Tax=Vanderwaltozyma polyspora (strain ATCC 22028 / DSM 70294 / BCRC 21397 / CBS 2163 / NBRC 10782 / NRRL Y-8283 / UCD 57-17) TaxID=436907 RepID=A7THF8_VANPO|nr:uncharacterized protein Kpol_1039p31 [Vanderwaltozyma polyspora DSM 70294]EDO18282.1 hypothetical protein Kpol_1039p31 [Vanderwaltozyma polyspora DSM 70294]
MEFKNIDYNNNDGESLKSPSSSSSISDIEPMATTNRKAKPMQRENSPYMNHEGKKHVRIAIDEDKSTHYNEVSKVPSFQKRPLSDTPVGSVWNSPRGSNENTPEGSREGSSLNLLRLNKITSNPELDSNTFNTPKDSPLASGRSSPGRFLHPKKKTTTLDVPGLTKSKSSPDGTISTEDAGSKLIIIMVGLPATGKSFITNKLSRYLNYSMYYCKAFNVGNTRRQYAKDHGLKEQDSSFFDPNNAESKKLREKWATDTLHELLDYLLIGIGSVGIFDATNTTVFRRKHVLEMIRERSKDIQVMFLETICSDKSLVEKNIRLKLLGPDYKGKDPETSLRDFKERLINYSAAYEPITDAEDIPYIKMIDVGKKVISYKIQGFLASQTVYYLLNFTLAERQIWITRNGESEYNVKGRIGGDSNLTARGEKYALALTKFINEQRELFHESEVEKNKEDSNKNEDHQVNEFFVWSSTRKRCVQTTQYFDEVDYPIKQMKMLEELNAGDCEGMTYSEIKRKYPEGYAERQRDKLRYRYPGIGGESYMDVINRVRAVITEIERIEDNILIVTHRVVARVLLGYFLNLSKDIIANLDIPLHCVYCLDIQPYGISWTLWEYNEATDSFSKVPQTGMNTKKVKEVGLVYKEKRYSIVPTAPSGKTHKHLEPKLVKSASADSYPSMNEILFSEAFRTKNGKSSKQKADEDKSHKKEEIKGIKPISEQPHHFEILELEKKLAKLKNEESSKYSDNDPKSNDNN